MQPDSLHFEYKGIVGMWIRQGRVCKRLATTDFIGPIILHSAQKLSYKYLLNFEEYLPPNWEIGA